ncbi:hypothetical protein GA0115259_101183 [Streptomyces sp. MnatMP-M17]|nr:hypothetical protein GA0115259_101183 [Streptomyces sp. MnatMP-M17]
MSEPDPVRTPVSDAYGIRALRRGISPSLTRSAVSHTRITFDAR